MLLRNEPKVFIPRLATTALYTLYAIYTIMLAADLYANQTPEYVQQQAGKVLLLFASSILLYLIDVVSYAMYPKIVEDHHEGREISLMKALSSALKAWPTLLLLAMLLFIILVAASLMAAFFDILYLVPGNVVYVFAPFNAPFIIAVGLLLLFAVFIAVGLLLLFAVLVFFVVPIAVIDGKGAVESFRESFRLGLKHRKQLLQVNIIFAVLVLSTMLLVALPEFSGQTSYAAIILFIAVRLVQAVVYTYISVTNPQIYLSMAEFNKSGPE